MAEFQERQQQRRDEEIGRDANQRLDGILRDQEQRTAEIVAGTTNLMLPILQQQHVMFRAWANCFEAMLTGLEVTRQRLNQQQQPQGQNYQQQRDRSGA